MYTVTRTGSAKAVAAALRGVPAQKVPLVTAKALTFTVQRAQADIIKATSSVFEGGATRYTLGATRIEPATVDKLEARVAVKDRSTTGGTLPENYLFPEVFGGARREKRFERALRFAGLLRGGERALPGDFAPRDAQGNYRVGQLRTLLASVKGLQREDQRTRTGRPRRVRKDVFVGQPGKAGSLPGIYRRIGTGKARKLQPLLVFVTKQPSYRKRLDFEAIARTAAEREFAPIFQRLLGAELR